MKNKNTCIKHLSNFIIQGTEQCHKFGHFHAHLNDFMRIILCGLNLEIDLSHLIFRKNIKIGINHFLLLRLIQSKTYFRYNFLPQSPSVVFLIDFLNQ